MKINCPSCDKILTQEQINNDICWYCDKPIKDKLTPVQLTAIENEAWLNADNGVSNTVENIYSYPALESISGFIKFIAWVGLIGSIIIALMAQANRVDGTTLLIYILSGLISFVILLATSEIIRLFINMAKDLRLLKNSIIKDD
jgi:hypothetical protein